MFFFECMGLWISGFLGMACAYACISTLKTDRAFFSSELKILRDENKELRKNIDALLPEVKLYPTKKDHETFTFKYEDEESSNE
jgi:hypothetical protein